MKKIFLLIILSILCITPIHAEVTWTFDGNTLTISGTGNMESYYWDNYAPWYSQRESIKNVVIENGVTNISYYAFYDCNVLTSVTIPNSVTSIEDYAFNECSALTSITIPNSVTYIGCGAFYNCCSLTSIAIPNTVIHIQPETFSGCTSLTSIDIPNSIQGIGRESFCGCRSLKSIILPNSVISIDSRAFSGCHNLSSVTIPNSVAYIENNGDDLFEGCYILAENFINNSSFDFSIQLVDIEQEDGLLVKGNEVVNCRTWATSVVIPNNVTSIGDSAFYECKNLFSVVIPNSVISIGNSAFAHCEKLASVTIPNGVTSIGNNTFYDCGQLVYATIPNGITKIGDYAFYSCGKLASITIPNSVKTIGKYAFAVCDNLSSIFIPKNVESIGTNAFVNCSCCTKISVEEGNIYYDSRNNCNAIIRKEDEALIQGCVNTIIPNTVKKIGQGAFVDCDGLTSINIPNSISSIGYMAFFCCKDLTSILIPNSVTEINQDVFWGCEKLNNVIIHTNENLQIGRLAFYDCGLDNLVMSGEALPAFTDEDFAMGLYNTVTLHIPSALYDEYCSTSPWSKFKNIVKLPDEPITLVDGETFTNKKERNGQEISYTRTFNHTKWQALYIPFSMSYEDWKNDFDIAYINGIRQYDMNDDGAIDETVMDVIKIKQGSLIPNTPYLIRAKTTGEKTITVNNATLYKAEENSIDCRTTIAEYTFTGTYSTIPASTLIANNYYAMGDGSLVITDGTSDLKPYRWYMKIDSRSPMYNVSNGAKAITINVVGDEETTGVSQLQITNDELPVYDLNGRKVNENNLKPGIYVKNGKKVVVK